MKSVILKALVVSTALACQLTYAFSDIAITAGALTTEASSDDSSIEGGSGTGFFAGVMGYMEFGEGLWLRSGAVLAQRKYELESGNNDFEFTLTNIEVPITAMYMANEMIGVFGGLRLSLNTSDECDVKNVSGATCVGDATDINSMMYGAEVGGHFRFTPNFGAEAAYVIGLSDIAEDISWDSGLIISGFFIF